MEGTCHHPVDASFSLAWSMVPARFITQQETEEAISAIIVCSSKVCHALLIFTLQEVCCNGGFDLVILWLQLPLSEMCMELPQEDDTASVNFEDGGIVGEILQQEDNSTYVNSDEGETVSEIQHQEDGTAYVNPQEGEIINESYCKNLKETCGSQEHKVNVSLMWMFAIIIS